MGSSDLVVPFRGERYRATDRLSALIAPPYDVITPEQRGRYAAWDSHNIVHVMLPEAMAHEDRYARAAALLAAWRARGVLVTDAEPSVCVLAQEYQPPDGPARTRLGVFAAVAAEPYEAGRVKPHEKTHAGPKADRLALLRATRTNLESIFLIAPDADGALAAAPAAIRRPAPTARPERGAALSWPRVRGPPWRRAPAARISRPPRRGRRPSTRPRASRRARRCARSTSPSSRSWS